MLDDVKVSDLFPTPLFMADLKPEIAATMNRRIVEILDRMASPRPKVAIGEPWQTDPYLHRVKEFKELMDVIEAAAKGALRFLDIEYGAIEITGCWANINPRGSMNTRHSHPNNFLSGVYYVQVPEEANAIVFADPRPQAGAIVPKVGTYNKYNGNDVTLQVKEGRLIMFPAWLVHGVPINRSERERISISFNIMFAGFTEAMARPLWMGNIALKPPT